jgi:hypothetical protein
METDSQQCIDGLTTYRRRWGKNGWRKDDGNGVENAEIIMPLAKEIDQRNVGFQKVKMHSHDQWNDLADSLAVKDRDQQSKEVDISLVFRAVISKREQFVGFERMSIQDFWPKLVPKCGDVIRAPADYEIWLNQCKLAKALVTGEQYEITSRSTPGFVKPSEVRRQRRSSIDFGEQREPTDPACPKTREAPDMATPPRRSEAEVE